IPENLSKQVETLSGEGKTPLLFTENGRLAGIVAVADVIKADSPQAIRELQNMGIRVVMLTGDNPRTAKAIGAQAGVDDVIAGVLPDGKEAVVRALAEKGKVAMVGDGINDAPALTRADIGIAIGAGADVAVDAADVVLMKSRLSDVPAAIRLSRATLRNIHQNLFWAFIYNTIGIPLAAGVFIPLFGWTLNPMFGAAAMSLSSFSVVSNALRLNWFKLRDASRDRKAKAVNISDVIEKLNIVEEAPAQPVGIEMRVEIEGMMCEHCEARIKKALEKLPGVLSASADHHTGIATLRATQPLDAEALKQAIEAQDYVFISIHSPREERDNANPF
ncbi:MAG: metal-transporting ATPase, partial [bacterium]